MRAVWLIFRWIDDFAGDTTVQVVRLVAQNQVEKDMFIKELISAKKELHEMEVNNVDTEQHHPERKQIDEIEADFREPLEYGWDVPPEDYPDPIGKSNEQVGFNSIRHDPDLPEVFDDPEEAVKDIESS